MDAFHDLLNQMRPVLLRAARNRLRNPDWADDAVSDTLLAALQRRPGFTEPARVRAWLFGILRNKVIDQLRVHLKDQGVHGPADPAAGAHVEIGDPCPLADPVRRVAHRQFIAALNRQLADMPPAHARAFVMREFMGDDTAAICGELDVSAGHLWVMLHRARSRLRRSLSEYGA